MTSSPPRRAAGALRRAARTIGRLALVELLVVPLWSCDPFHTGFDDTEPARSYQAQQVVEPAQNPQTLKVMTWNVKFGGGRIDFFFDCHGDRVLMTKGETTDNVRALARAIRQLDPDILLLQEVDVSSKRAAYVDQVRMLLDSTTLNYAVYASQWKADYVPSDGLGQVDSGNAILSKYPITRAERIALPLIGDQDGITQYFYLKRNILHAEVALPNRPDKKLHVLNVHTAAFSKDGTKKIQIDRFKDELDGLASAGEWFVAGGDLNALPPGSVQTSGFPDSACPADGDFDADSYAAETDWLQPLYDAYTTAIPLDDYKADNGRYTSHTTSADHFWNRKLDYLFTNTTRVAGSGEVHQSAERGGIDTIQLSDHAPVSMTVEVFP